MGSSLYDFTMDKHDHYGKTSFEDLCHRAHVAPWEALGQEEPAKWSFKCGCCGEVRAAREPRACVRSQQATHRALAPRPSQTFDSEKGGRAKLEKLDATLAAMEDGPRTSKLKRHAKKHLAQQLRREPLIPFHYVVFDPMHGVHNEINVLLDEAVHKHLVACEESKDKQVLSFIFFFMVYQAFFFVFFPSS